LSGLRNKKDFEIEPKHMSGSTPTSSPTPSPTHLSEVIACGTECQNERVFIATIVFSTIGAIFAVIMAWTAFANFRAKKRAAEYEYDRGDNAPVAFKHIDKVMEQHESICATDDKKRHQAAVYLQRVERDRQARKSSEEVD
jgi:hypothetical protein